MFRFEHTSRTAVVMAIVSLAVTPRGMMAQAGAVAAVPDPQTPVLTGIRFFESGPATPVAADRRYAESFETVRARFIGVELTFEIEAGSQPFDVDCTYLTAQDSVLGSIEVPFVAEPDWTSVRTARILGWERPGNWKVGTYRVTCAIAGTNVADGSFEVVDGPADIASVDAKVSRIRFFGSGPQTPPVDQRTYATSFASAETAYMNVELTLVHGAIETGVDVPVACLIIGPDAAIRASFAVRFSFQPEWRSTINSNGWGRAEPGYWTAGRYRVACTAEGKLVAEDVFEIT